MSDSRHTAQRIVIIGGGVAGLSIAVRLAQAGLPVTVLEASQLGHAASGRNQGWLYSGAWFAREDAELARMCYESLQTTLQFCPDCLEPQQEEMAFFISKPDTMSSEWTEAWKKAGIPYQELPVEDVFDQIPGLKRSTVQRAFRLPDRSIRTDVLVQRLAATAQNAGVEIRTETSAVDIHHKQDRVEYVVTATGEQVWARMLILATGAPGSELLSKLMDHRAGRQSDITPVLLKTHLVAVQPELSRLPFCFLDAEGFHHLPHAPTSVFGFSRWLPVTSPFNQQADPEELKRLWALVERFFPDFHRDEHQVVEWAGVAVQAMHADQVDPGTAPRPTVLDHLHEAPSLSNLLSVYPGRATLWAHLAEEARKVVLDKLEDHMETPTRPPWSLLDRE